MKIYFFIMDMFLENPCVFVNKEGEKQDLTEIEFVLKVVGPILDIIFRMFSTSLNSNGEKQFPNQHQLVERSICRL